MNEPKYKINQAVMVRSKDDPSLNTDFTVIKDVEHFKKGWSITQSCGKSRLDKDYYGYSLSHLPEGEFVFECILRPLPPEQSTGDFESTKQFIDSLRGVTCG